MTAKSSEQVTVAGAGAFGLCIALALARQGLSVVVRDPAPFGDNASGVAAGMLAPVFETALDPASADAFDLLMAARDLWPALADSLGIDLDRSGAAYYGEHIGRVAARLRTLGVSSGVYGDRVYTREDWRLSPGAAMAALRVAAGQAGVRFEATRVASPPADGLLILATGADSGGLAPELALLAPVKGHILRYQGGPDIGPVIRGDGVYICPDPAGAIVGATMEHGVADRTVDAERVAGLRATAEALLSDLAHLEAAASTGVRAATPDGLPMVGWSRRPGIMLAVGARRNGWLLAPLVARAVAAYVAGEDPESHAARFDPRRFDHKETGA